MKIKVYLKVSEMDGVGEEWLVDEQGNVRVVFIDGNLACKVYQFKGNADITVAGVKSAF